MISIFLQVVIAIIIGGGILFLCVFFSHPYRSSEYRKIEELESLIGGSREPVCLFPYATGSHKREASTLVTQLEGSHPAVRFVLVEHHPDIFRFLQHHGGDGFSCGILLFKNGVRFGKLYSYCSAANYYEHNHTSPRLEEIERWISRILARQTPEPEPDFYYPPDITVRIRHD